MREIFPVTVTIEDGDIDAVCEALSKICTVWDSDENTVYCEVDAVWDEDDFYGPYSNPKVDRYDIGSVVSKYADEWSVDFVY